MYYVCGIGDDEVDSSVNKCLEALALRKRAEAEMERGDFYQAHTLLTQVPFIAHMYCFVQVGIFFGLQQGWQQEKNLEHLRMLKRLRLLHPTTLRFYAAEESYSIA
ncbi:uncharacterized protein LOC142531113 [Primulina tabacum]|uniref:uncharacterized protein LOC142531113 n=1 Tax=Primulina tabacum TaxID=48773 RepID=UPI003F59D5BA